MKKDYVVIGGSASKRLAKNISKKLDAKFLNVDVKIFPDGESKITIAGKLCKGNFIVVQSTYPPVDSNLIQALLLISRVREVSNEVIAVIPYMGYAKQDKEFLKGEIITVSVIAELFKAAGATRIIVVDFHSSEALDFFKLPITNISANSLFVEHFKKIKLKHPLVVSPDMFWKCNAEILAKQLGASVLALNKQRNRTTGELSIKSAIPRISKESDLILFDDMVSTGRTILKAIKFLKKENFRRIFVACTHPVFLADSEKKFKTAGITQIIGTNSVEGKFAKLDLSDIIVKAILKDKN